MVVSSSKKYLPVRTSCCYPYVWRSFPARSAGVCWKQGKADKRHLSLAFPVVSITGRAFQSSLFTWGMVQSHSILSKRTRHSVARIRKPPHALTASWRSKNKIRKAFFLSKLPSRVGNVLRLMTVILTILLYSTKLPMNPSKGLLI